MKTSEIDRCKLRVAALIYGDEKVKEKLEKSFEREDFWDGKLRPGDALAGDVLYEDFLRSSYR